MSEGGAALMAVIAKVMIERVSGREGDFQPASGYNH
jgi:hypothetical protein